MAARKSKRLTLKKKARITKKVRDNFKSKNKEIARKDKFYGKVPRGILMTNKEIEDLNKHKEQVRLINEEYLKTRELNEKRTTDYMCDLDPYMVDTELFIEVCDYRDVEGSRNQDFEKTVLKKGKKLMIWLNYVNEIIANTSGIESDGIKMFEDMEALGGIKKLCIFGYPKSGKFYLKNIIKEARNDIECNIVCGYEYGNENGSIGVSEVLRGTIEEDKIDVVYFAKKLFENINFEEFSEYYRITYGTTDIEKLLENLGEKLIGEGKQREKIKKGASKLINDMKTNNIIWAFTNNGLIIKFK